MQLQWSRLNLFQRLVRQWDALHPYNAAQIMQLDTAPNPSQLTDAWREMLGELGLGRLNCAGDRYRFECLNGDAGRYSVQIIGAGTTLESYITEQLNLRFDQQDLPLRPFALSVGESHYVGVVYHHWIADSASIRLLLREWFFRLFDAERARRRPLRMPSGGYWRSFGPARRGWRLDDGVLTSLRWSSRLKRVRRVEKRDFADYRAHFSFHSSPDGIVNILRSAAHRHGATVNDLFIATVAELCHRHQMVKRTPRRQDLALGSIVDLRARAPTRSDGLNEGDVADAFGLFLGFTSVILRPRDFTTFGRLVQRVAVETRMQKRNGAPEASMIRMLAALAAHHILGPEKVKQFYRKRLPLAGGVSNVNLNGTWVEQYSPSPIVSYLRVSPSGPIMPLVFTPTTLGNRLNFGLTCRASVVSPALADQMSAAFIERLLNQIVV